MKFKIHLHAAVLCLMLVACLAMGLMAPSKSYAQSDPAVVVPVPEWDWSDYRGTAKGRLFLARLSSINISGTRNGTGTGLNGTFDVRRAVSSLSNDVQLFKEIIGTFYVDRLGIRVCAQEATVAGRHEALSIAGSPSASTEQYPQLDIGPTTIGLDLDIIRYPFMKLGCNLDVGLHGARFKNVLPRVPNAIEERAEWRSDGPITIGIHGQAIPFRVKEVPAILVARLRTPVPFLQQVSSALGLKQLSEIARVQVLDWEVSAGLRPAVWETSAFGHSTFSFAVEIGYRSYTIDTPLRPFYLPERPQPGSPQEQQAPAYVYPQNLEMHANWQGAFFQAAVFY